MAATLGSPSTADRSAGVGFGQGPPRTGASGGSGGPGRRGGSGGSGGSGSSGSGARPAPPAERARRVRWGPVCGVVTLLYVALLGMQLAAVGFGHRLFNRMHQLEGNAVARVTLGAVVVAMLFHGLDGLRITVCALAPGLQRRERALRACVQFLTFALGLPAAFLIIWPAIDRVLPA